MKFWVSILLLVVSIAYTFYGISTLAFKTPDGQPGSGFFPLVIGCCLIIFTLINMIIEFKKRANEDSIVTFKYTKEIIFTFLALIIFAFTLRLLGGLLSMILFVGLILFIFNKEKIVQNILISLIFPIMVFGLFNWLNAGLPKGFLGF